MELFKKLLFVTVFGAVIGGNAIAIEYRWNGCVFPRLEYRDNNASPWAPTTSTQMESYETRSWIFHHPKPTIMKAIREFNNNHPRLVKDINEGLRIVADFGIACTFAYISSIMLRRALV